MGGCFQATTAPATAKPAPRMCATGEATATTTSAIDRSPAPDDDEVWTGTGPSGVAERAYPCRRNPPTLW